MRHEYDATSQVLQILSMDHVCLPSPKVKKTLPFLTYLARFVRCLFALVKAYTRNRSGRSYSFGSCGGESPSAILNRKPYGIWHMNLGRFEMNGCMMDG